MWFRTLRSSPEAWKLVILAVSQDLGGPVFLIRGLRSAFDRSPGRRKKPKERVWGKLRSWFPLWEPTNPAEEPSFEITLRRFHRFGACTDREIRLDHWFGGGHIVEIKK